MAEVEQSGSRSVSNTYLGGLHVLQGSRFFAFASDNDSAIFDFFTERQPER